MKHNLFFSMLAAALMGGQVFAEPTVYKVSDYSEGSIISIGNNDAKLDVDAQKTLARVVAPSVSQCLTLDYQGEFVLKASGQISMPLKGMGVLNITSTVDTVKTSWEDAFSEDGGGSITLSSGNIYSSHGSVQFFGQDKDNTVKLGNSEVKFMGVVDALSALDMNQVGVVWGSNDITLVGKIGSSPTPEPTTGSLSLLALAGLCARRRRK